MQTLAYTYLTVAAVLILAGQVFFSNTSMDIQLYDTYFVFTFRSLIIPILLVCLLLFSITAALKSGFKKKLYNFLVPISLISFFLYMYIIFGAFLLA